MTIRTGVDIVDIPKFAKNIKNASFVRKVFTRTEIAVCEGNANPLPCYAGKFAAKEAFMKAIGKGIRQEVWFTQIEVLECNTEKTYIQFKGKAKERASELRIKQIDTNISHSKDMVVATVFIETKKDQAE